MPIDALLRDSSVPAAALEGLEQIVGGPLEEILQLLRQRNERNALQVEDDYLILDLHQAIPLSIVRQWVRPAGIFVAGLVTGAASTFLNMPLTFP